MKYNSIIIGAGLGGLTAAAKLALAGKKVLLIEQHNIVGGCATTIKRKNFKIDVGFHKIDGLGKNDVKVKIFNELGVFKNIDFIKIPEFYRFVSDNVDIVIPLDYKKAINILVKRFPHEKKGIIKFYKVIINIQKEVRIIPRSILKIILFFPVLAFLCPTLLIYRNKTIGDYLDSKIKDNDLKLTLLANLKYYHDNPHTLSLIFYSIAQTSFFTGAYYIKGGSQNLSDHLANVIKSNNGDILLNHTVKRIITKNDHAIGVIFSKNNETDEITRYAENIIANVSVSVAVNKLLSTENMVRFKKKIKDQLIACSLFSIYLGFKTPVLKLGNRNYSTFVLHKNTGNLSELGNSNKDFNFMEKNFVFVDYSQINAGLTCTGKSTGVINVIDYYDNWKDLDEDEYKIKKEKCSVFLIDRLEKLIPGIKDEIEYKEVSTPKTIFRYTGNPQGTPYGFAQTPMQAGLNRVGNICPVKNLFFASAWTCPGGGFTGAIVSGYNCASAILKLKAV